MNRAEVLAAIPDTRTRSLVALLLRTPAELEQERQARQPAPPPGHRKGPKSGLQRAQGAGVGLTYHPDAEPLDFTIEPLDLELGPMDLELEPPPFSRL